MTAMSQATTVSAPHQRSPIPPISNKVFEGSSGGTFYRKFPPISYTQTNSYFISFSREASLTQTAKSSDALPISSSEGKDGAILMFLSSGSFL